MAGKAFIACVLGALASAVHAEEQCGPSFNAVFGAMSTSECGQKALADYCAAHPSKPTPPPADGGNTPAPPDGGNTPAPPDEQPPSGPPNPPPTTGGSEPFIGSYYPNWMVYRKHYMGLARMDSNGQAISPEEAKAEYTVFPVTVKDQMAKLNAIYYAFLNLDDNCMIADTDPDASWYGAGSVAPGWIPTPAGSCKGAVNDLLSLKSQYPHLKLLVSVGGWTYSKNFSRCVKDPANFEIMWNSFSHYVKDDFGRADSMWAGIDFDWEHPGAAGLTNDFDTDPKVDWSNYAELVTYFRKRANDEGRDKMMITTAMGVGDTLDIFVSQKDSAKKWCDALDHVNLMTYDFHGKFEPTTGHNAPFCQVDSGADARPAPKDLPWAVRDRTNAVANICGYDKLAVGIPNYSPAWTDIPAGPNNDGLYQNSTNTDNWARLSTFSDSDKALVAQGIMHWWDLKNIMAAEPSLEIHSKICSADETNISVPVKWLYSGSKKIFITLEDPETVAAKTQWARAKGMAGFFSWDISQDKTGELLDAGRRGWGVSTTYPASGTKTCHDSDKPDFDSRPDGSEDPYKGCHITEKSVQAVDGQGCTAIRNLAQQQCGDKKAIAVGGVHTGQTGCVNPCTTTWGNGQLWANDLIYFVCDGETLPPEGSVPPGNGGSGNGGSGNGGSGTPCFAHPDWASQPNCIDCSGSVQDGQCTSAQYTSCYPTMDACNAGTSGRS